MAILLQQGEGGDIARAKAEKKSPEEIEAKKKLLEEIAPGQLRKGVVKNIAEFGAFVTLAPGIDGMVHVSEIASHRIERVKDALAVGQEIEAIVMAVDVAKKRISLSIRAALAADEQADDRAGHRQQGITGCEGRAH